MGLKIVYLSSSKFILDGLRVVNPCLVLSRSTTVSFITVVRIYCRTGSVYCLYTVLFFITSLPVYPTTGHGHCTTVVAATSNRVFCILLLMEQRYSVVHSLP